MTYLTDDDLSKLDDTDTDTDTDTTTDHDADHADDHEDWEAWGNRAGSELDAFRDKSTDALVRSFDNKDGLNPLRPGEFTEMVQEDVVAALERVRRGSAGEPPSHHLPPGFDLSESSQDLIEATVEYALSPYTFPDGNTLEDGGGDISGARGLHRQLPEGTVDVSVAVDNPERGFLGIDVSGVHCRSQQDIEFHLTIAI